MAKQKQYNKGNLGKAFAFKQTFFDTKDHPARAKNERKQCISFKIAKQEEQLFDGIASSLQTSRANAIRVALWEFEKAGQVPNVVEHKGRDFTKEWRAPGFSNRVTDIRLRLSDYEYLKVQIMAENLGVSKGEMLRIIAHEFSRQITDGTIKRLESCTKQNESKRMNEWLKDARATNKPKTNLMQAAQERTEELRDEAWERQAEEYEYIGNLMKMEQANGCMHIYIDENGIFDKDALVRSHQIDADTQWEETYGIKGRQSKAQFIMEMKTCGATLEEALKEWEEELKDRKDYAEFLKSNPHPL